MKLETERLILRDFVMEDWQRIQEYQNDPLYLRYYEWAERTPEAAHAMMDFGFQRFRVHRIRAGCIAENSGSAHVLEKLGMRLEGRFREHRYFKDLWWDSLISAILEEEWQSHKKAHPMDWKLVEE